MDKLLVGWKRFQKKWLDWCAEHHVTTMSINKECIWHMLKLLHIAERTVTSDHEITDLLVQSPALRKHAHALFHGCKNVIFIIIISILEPVFLYRGLGFLTSLPRRRPLHSEQFSVSAESIPSFSLSFFITSSHDFLGLPDLFCATTFSFHTSEIQPVLRTTCPNHLILLVRSTTSKSWMPSFVRRESELTSSFALTLQIQRIMARSLRRRRFSVSAFMAQVSAACSIMLLTHDEYTLPLGRRGTRRLVRRESNCRNLPQALLQRVTAASSQPPPAESMSPR